MDTKRIIQSLHFIRSNITFKLLSYPLESGREKLDRQLIFIIGASGSGTTMLSRILCSPRCVIGIDDFKDVPIHDTTARAAVDRFKIITERLWDRAATPETYGKAKAAVFSSVDELFGIEFYKNATHLIHKRSAPFFRGDRFRPDLSDLFDIFGDPRIIVIYRDPRESTYSSLRRGFYRNLKESAVIIEDQLTYINAQISLLDKDCYKLISYENFCLDPQRSIEGIAEFCKLPHEELKQAVVKENVTPSKMGQWKKALPAQDVDFLDRFFNERRLAQWPVIGSVKDTAGR